MRTIPRPKSALPLPLALALALALALPLHAQQPAPSPGEAALAACSQAAGRGEKQEARRLADRAESIFQEQLRREPGSADARAGLARVISECRIRFANFLSAGRMAGQSTRLLEEALRIDPRHWSARFTLAMNHFHTPEFLGKGDDARRELETLIEQQGGRADLPHLALPHLYLGELHRREGREADAQRVWSRGAELFPENAKLRERIAQPRAEGEPAAAPAPVMAAAPAPAARVEADAAADAAQQAPSYALDEIRVRARRVSTEATVSSVSLNRIEVLTAPGGTADLLHGIRMQGGVTQASDGSDLFVRGGEPAEAPVWVDGGRMFYPGTFESLDGGLFGVLNPNVIREAVFYGGGFSARYGNALSGVLDVQSEGRPSAQRMQLGMDLAGGRASAWLPLNDRLGVWGTGRVTDATLLVKMQGIGDEFTASPRSFDLTTGVVASPRRGVELKATTILQGDGGTRLIRSHGHEGTFRSSGGTRHGVLSARATRADGAQVNGALAISSRGTGYTFGVLDREREDVSLALSLSSTLPVNGWLTMSGGVEGTRYSTTERGTFPASASVAPGSPADTVSSAALAHHAGAFVEAQITASERLTATAGLRADRLPGEAVTTADPRLALAYRADEWMVRLSGGVFHQGRWRQGYTIPDDGRPGGLPRRARHLVLGVERDQALRLEAYVKEYDRYAEDGSGPQVVAGTVFGADARLRWEAGERLSGWVAYSLLKGEVELEQGGTVPSRIDVTHGLTAVGKLAIATAWELGTTARYATGRPYTPVLGAIADPAAMGEPLHGAIHSERLPDFQRLDVRLTHIGMMRNRRFVAYLELLNALDRPNVMGYTYDDAYQHRRAVRSFFANRLAMLGAEVVFN